MRTWIILCLQNKILEKENLRIKLLPLFNDKEFTSYNDSLKKSCSELPLRKSINLQNNGAFFNVKFLFFS